MQHIIRKQIIELTLGTNQDAFQLQHRVSNHFYEKIIPMLNDVFDNISNEDEQVIIDRLEINLGSFEAAKFENGQWTQELIKKITEQIQLEINKTGRPGDILTTARPLSICSQWLHYMKHGFLKWNTALIDDNWYDNVLAALASDYTRITELRFVIQRKSFVVKRIVQQHNQIFLKKLVEILTAENQNALPAIIDELHFVLSEIFYLGKKISLAINQELKLKVWESVLQNAASDQKNLIPTRIGQNILDTYRIEIKNNQNNFLKKVPEFKNLEPFLSQLIKEESGSEKNPGAIPRTISSNESEPGLLKNADSLKDKAKPLKNEPDAEQIIDSLAEKINLQKINPKEIHELNNQEQEKVFAVEQGKNFSEGIYLQNAGVVLLHPFLKMFFEQLKIIKAGNFINEGAQQKALYLLHYLATGISKAEEHELVIAKVLCSYPLQKPVEAAVKITKKEMREGDNLLKEVIQKWEKIKGTTNSGLREGFLQRNGKISVKNEKIILQVETTGIDVLLDFLPWNLSMIKLPWMKEMLRVEWR